MSLPESTMVVGRSGNAMTLGAERVLRVIGKDNDKDDDVDDVDDDGDDNKI